MQSNLTGYKIKEILFAKEQIACTKEEWESTVKTVCQDYLQRIQDLGQADLAKHILGEIRRLEKMFN